MPRWVLAGALLLAGMPAIVAMPAIAAGLQDRFDAVAAAPGSHEILLENDRIRVLRVSIAPGATEPVHAHHWPSIMYFEQAQPITYISYELVGTKPAEKARVDVPAEALPAVETGDPEGLHAVQNRGAQPFRALRVEFKDGRPVK